MTDLIREDFKEKEKDRHEWVAHKGGYQVVVRNYDGGSEIIIRAELSQDPTKLDWDWALKIVNQFYQNLRIVEGREDGHLEYYIPKSEEPPK